MTRREHPDYPGVFEYATEDIRALMPDRMFSMRGVCGGCPHGTSAGEPPTCPKDDYEEACGPGTVWYGQHIVAARILEGE